MYSIMFVYVQSSQFIEKHYLIYIKQIHMLAYNVYFHIP